MGLSIPALLSAVATFTITLLQHSPNPWILKPITGGMLKTSVTHWRESFDSRSENFLSSMEMIAWQMTTSQNNTAVGLYYYSQLRAVAQITHARDEEGNVTALLRAVCTPNEEDVAGSILVRTLLSYDVDVDWGELKKNPRWYVAALYLKNLTNMTIAT
tara:strand:+ start:2153 stop:2629 length:477 start_codon:yes stop_codon:yes gene_type:complete